MMKITDARIVPKPVSIQGYSIPDSTVFRGFIDGREGPWYKTPTTIANLRYSGKGFTSTNVLVTHFEPVDAELILR